MNTKQVHTCLDCLFSGNRFNEKGIIYCKYLQSPHNALKLCKKFYAESQVKISDLEIQSIVQEKRNERRNNQTIFWSIVVAAVILFVALIIK